MNRQSFQIYFLAPVDNSVHKQWLFPQAPTRYLRHSLLNTQAFSISCTFDPGYLQPETFFRLDQYLQNVHNTHRQKVQNLCPWGRELIFNHIRAFWARGK
jgi:hypothetical protein